MDVAPLLELMTEEAAAKRGAILARAREDAEAIRAEARDRAAAQHREATDALRADLDAQARRERDRAEAAANMQAQATKELLADEVLEAAAGDLRHFAGTVEFAPVLEALLEELINNAPEEVAVLVPPAHHDRVLTWLAAHGKTHLAVEPDPSLHDGVAVRDLRGRFRISNTLGLRLEKVESAARHACMAALFGKGA